MDEIEEIVGNQLSKALDHAMGFALGQAKNCFQFCSNKGKAYGEHLFKWLFEKKVTKVSSLGMRRSKFFQFLYPLLFNKSYFQ